MRFCSCSNCTLFLPFVSEFEDLEALLLGGVLVVGEHVVVVFLPAGILASHLLLSLLVYYLYLSSLLDAFW
jgi:hypothetical protein